MPSLVRLWSLLLLLPALSARGALTFLDAPFDRPDIDTLRELRRTVSERAPDVERELDLALVDASLADLHRLRGEPHAAREHRASVTERCVAWEDTGFENVPQTWRARAAGLCALARVENLAEAPSLFGDDATRAARDLALWEKSASDRDERWYVEGRVFALLPPGAGQSFRRALVAWTFLTRARPDLAGPAFWLARTAQLQRNEPRATEAYAEALARFPDSRARLFFDGRKLTRRAQAIDGLRFGWEPRLFFLPAVGLGAGIGLVDERIGDRSRALSAGVWAATRGNFGARAALDDGETLAGFRLAIQAAYVDGGEDYFGRGTVSRKSDLTRLTGSRSRVSAAVIEPFLDDFFLSIGWSGAHFGVRGVDGPAVPPDRDARFYSGPFAELAVDTRDSRIDPYRGLLASVRGEFPTEGWGSPRTFTAWRAQAHAYVPLGLRGRVALGGCLDSVEADAPFAAFPGISGGCALPGVREGRFRDRHAIALSAEIERRLLGPLSLAAFLTSGTVASEWSGLTRGAWHWGGGGAATLSLSAYTRPRVRMEAGVFAGEVVLLVGAGGAL